MDLADEQSVKRPAFEYRPLADSEQDIRVFEFAASADIHDIKLTISTRPLDDDLDHPYAALSYVWGDTTKLVNIEVNEKSFAVRPNAYYALQQAFEQRKRGHLTTDKFWMDSVCINQADLLEKAKQVQIMGTVFESADVVLACVGPHQLYSKLVFDVLRRLYFGTCPTKTSHEPTTQAALTIERRLSKILKQYSVHGLEPRRSFPSVTNILITAIVYFCNRDYWHRLWIVQEIHLARAAKIMCGFDMLDMEYIAPLFLSSASPYVESSSSIVRFSQSTFASWNKCRKHFMDTRMAIVLASSHFTGDAVRGERMPAHIAFKRLSSSGCKDFRDRVYALLRIVQWQDSKFPGKETSIRPDYNVSRFELGVRVIKELAQAELSNRALWDIVTSLCHAIGLGHYDPELSERRKCRKARAISECEYCVKAEGSQILHFTLQGLARLETDNDGLLVASSLHVNFVPADHVLEDASRWRTPGWPRNFELSSDSQDRRVVGWVCRSARPGDYLVPSLDNQLDGPLLIIRERDAHNGIFNIIGYAALAHSLVLEEKRMTVQLGILDYIALVAMWNCVLIPGHRDLWPLLHAAHPVSEVCSYVTLEDENEKLVQGTSSTSVVRLRSRLNDD